ncbi:MAG: ribosome maturation factor RimP [Dermatophilaceae bacterium]
MTGVDRAAEVTGLAAKALTGTGFLVEDVTITPSGRRRVLRIAVDRELGALAPDDHDTPVPPLSLDEVAAAARAISAALDEADALGEASYVLEVSSPGVGRPLSQPRHFRRNVGRIVQLRLTDGSERTGRLTSAAPEHVSLMATEGNTESAATWIPLTDIARARVLVDFAAAQTDDEEN